MKKLRGLIIMLIISLSLFGLTACGGENGKALTYEQITPQQAKEIMDTQQDYIIIDARTEEEFIELNAKNISGFEDKKEELIEVVTDVYKLRTQQDRGD